MEQENTADFYSDLLRTYSPEQRRLLEDKIYTLEQQLEDLKWKTTGSEIQKIELLNAKEQATRETIQHR